MHAMHLERTPPRIMYRMFEKCEYTYIYILTRTFASTYKCISQLRLIQTKISAVKPRMLFAPVRKI